MRREPPERCPRCRQADLIRVHAHDECPACRYVHPCCNGETAGPWCELPDAPAQGAALP